MLAVKTDSITQQRSDKAIGDLLWVVLRDRQIETSKITFALLVPSVFF